MSSFDKSGDSLTLYYPLLKVLSLKKFNKINKFVIKNSEKQLIQCITEICYNFTKGIIPLTSEQETWAKKNRKYIEILAQPKISVFKKRKLLLRKNGEFLIKILAPSLKALDFLKTN